MIKELKYYIMLDEEGKRISPGYREDGNVPDDVKANGFLATKAEFEKLLNGYLRDPMTGEFKEIPPHEPPLNELKAIKKEEVKAKRNELEVSPVEYNNNLYDFDADSRSRLDIAFKALSAQGETATIEWTMADNSTTKINASDINSVFITSAIRSNKLHKRYRQLKEEIDNAKTTEELGTITFCENLF